MHSHGIFGAQTSEGHSSLSMVGNDCQSAHNALQTEVFSPDR